MSKQKKVLQSVGALITDDQGRILLQKRDDFANIYFPGLWGVFGGAVENAETPVQAIIREVEEELSVVTFDPKLFLKWDICTEHLGAESRKRFFFHIHFDSEMVNSIKLQEGAEYRFFEPNDLPAFACIVPFDLAALSLYIHVKIIGSQIMPKF